jgi:hypothetical protein
MSPNLIGPSASTSRAALTTSSGSTPSDLLASTDIAPASTGSNVIRNAR